MKRVFALATAAVLALALGVQAEDKPGARKPGERPGAGKGRPGKPGEGGPGMMLSRLLEKADTNADGKISADEFKKAAENAPGGRLKDNPEMLNKLFTRLDADGDGFISKDELKKAAEQFQNRRPGKPGDKKPGDKKPQDK